MAAKSKAASPASSEDDLRRWARLINDAPAAEELKAALRALNVDPPDDLTNGAGIALAVYRAAVEGDLRAIEKWERFNGPASAPEDRKPKSLI